MADSIGLHTNNIHTCKTIVLLVPQMRSGFVFLLNLSIRKPLAHCGRRSNFLLTAAVFICNHCGVMVSFPSAVILQWYLKHTYVRPILLTVSKRGQTADWTAPRWRINSKGRTTGQKCHSYPRRINFSAAAKELWCQTMKNMDQVKLVLRNLSQIYVLSLHFSGAERYMAP